MEYYRSIIEKYIPNTSKNIKSSTRAVSKAENTYFSSKVQIDSLLSNLQFFIKSYYDMIVSFN